MTVSPLAVVTGVSSGIGAAVARRLLADGWRVAGISRTKPQFDDVALTFIPLDLLEAEPAEIRAALSESNPTALVHAAGVLRVGRLGELDHAAGREMWRLHVDASSVLADTLAPRLPDGGRIVLIGSRVAAGAAGRGQYAGTKAALSGLARSWAAELAPRGITVNVVAPGATDTPMLRDPARAAEPPRVPPIGRLVRPEEVAALTAFLLSPLAGAITGQSIAVCGGASL